MLFIFYLIIFIIIVSIFVYFKKLRCVNKVKFFNKKVYLKIIEHLCFDDFKVFEISLDGNIDLSSLKIFINDVPLNKSLYSFSCDTQKLFLTFYFYNTPKYIYGDKISISYKLLNKKKFLNFKKFVTLECFEANDSLFYSQFTK